MNEQVPVSSPKPAPASSPFASRTANLCALRPGDAELWRELARAAGLRWFSVDATRLRNKDGLLEAVGAALHFPDYFRRNWDAFEECLRDLDWLDEGGVVLYVGPVDSLAAAAPEDLATFITIAQDCARASAGSARALWVLVGAPKAPDGVEMLSLPG